MECGCSFAAAFLLSGMRKKAPGKFWELFFVII